MACCRQETSRIKCANDAVRRTGLYTSKTKCILRLLRTQHRTLNLSFTLLKQKAVEKIRALSLVRKKLVKTLMWLEENFTILSCLSRLFRRKPTVSQPSLAVDGTEIFCRELYEQEISVQTTPTLALFEEYCNDDFTDPGECPSVITDEIKQALSCVHNFTVPGVDGIINFWWKSFLTVHEGLAQIFTTCNRGANSILACRGAHSARPGLLPA